LSRKCVRFIDNCIIKKEDCRVSDGIDTSGVEQCEIQSVIARIQRLDVVRRKVVYDATWRGRVRVTHAIELELCLSTAVDADLEVHCPNQFHVQCNSRTCVLSESIEWVI
jgi:hypothetical protein